MIAHYRAAVLAALWDVEIALSAIGHLDLEADAQAESLSQSELALAGGGSALPSGKRGLSHRAGRAARSHHGSRANEAVQVVSVKGRCRVV